ncbi:MAG TPA: amidohydrolase family protein, partial [Vicinamibacteria bacterium]|nr:amidohydrolase family protein [Vicinamibacteria bacterium]
MAPGAIPAPLGADLVLRGGRVFPGKDLPEATALAVADGRVVAVGPSEAVAPWIGPRTRVVELRGRLVVPGFNDSHVHLMDGGFGLLSVPLRDARDEHEWARRIGSHARTLPEGAWVLNGQWDHEAWPGTALPTRKSLDAETPAHPVFVMRLDGHMALANSVALSRAGITRETPDPPGGAILRGPQGEP